MNLLKTALDNLSYAPLPGQLDVIKKLCNFCDSLYSKDVFLLNGYAGTGKTSIIGSIIKALVQNQRKIILLAPTGRAAKVAGNMATHKSCTVHKHLFRSFGNNPSDHHFVIAPNTETDTIFFVDEATLLSDSGDSNSLLHQLIKHVYSSAGCKLVLIGDLAQLPPVGQNESTALNPERLLQLGLNPVEGVLDIPVRQASESGILYNATLIRHFLFSEINPKELHFKTNDFQDIEVVSSAELDDYLSTSYSSVGQEETIIITRSNKRANNYNQAIRKLVLDADTPVQRGERIIISKNDYYWSKKNKLSGFIANGEIAIVNWVGRPEKYYGRYFCETELYLPAEDTAISATIMLRSLVTEGPRIPEVEMQRLYNAVSAQCEGVLSEKIKATMEDPYYNALQAKYAYCITCHKAQGGQWKHVYIDMAGISKENLDSDFLRWLYTAVTRASQKVFLINPGEFIES